MSQRRLLLFDSHTCTTSLYHPETYGLTILLFVQGHQGVELIPHCLVCLALSIATSCRSVFDCDWFPESLCMVHDVGLVVVRFALCFCIAKALQDPKWGHGHSLPKHQRCPQRSAIDRSRQKPLEYRAQTRTPH